MPMNINTNGNNTNIKTYLYPFEHNFCKIKVKNNINYFE